jgi:hypothetical protein
LYKYFKQTLAIIPNVCFIYKFLRNLLFVKLDEQKNNWHGLGVHWKIDEGLDSRWNIYLQKYNENQGVPFF